MSQAIDSNVPRAANDLRTAAKEENIVIEAGSESLHQDDLDRFHINPKDDVVYGGMGDIKEVHNYLVTEFDWYNSLPTFQTFMDGKTWSDGVVFVGENSRWRATEPSDAEVSGFVTGDEIEFTAAFEWNTVERL